MGVVDSINTKNREKNRKGGKLEKIKLHTSTSSGSDNE